MAVRVVVLVYWDLATTSTRAPYWDLLKYESQYGARMFVAVAKSQYTRTTTIHYSSFYFFTFFDIRYVLNYYNSRIFILSYVLSYFLNFLVYGCWLLFAFNIDFFNIFIHSQPPNKTVSTSAKNPRSPRT